MRRSVLALAVMPLVALLAGCGGNELPPDSPGTFAGDNAPAAKAATPLPPNTLRRSAVLDAVARGPGAFLQRVELDDRPVFEGGQFHGFRIAALRGDPEFWHGVDLRPGDVVTRVNGVVVQKPDDAQTALQSLEVASELVVDFDREGQPHELKFAIYDDVPGRASAPPPNPAPSASAAPSTTQAPAPKK
jgi:S1-C subfamily serine protease